MAESNSDFADRQLAAVFDTTVLAGRPHDYVSTACQHDLCGSCRNTCKFCDVPCQHSCHPGGAPSGVSRVDQGRSIARELLAAWLGNAGNPELADRIADDPDLFWLRGEEAPAGVWKRPLDDPPVPGDV